LRIPAGGFRGHELFEGQADRFECVGRGASEAVVPAEHPQRAGLLEKAALPPRIELTPALEGALRHRRVDDARAV
jgi:hypothetical protein